MGTIRGLGLQSKTVSINIFSYWAIFVPMAYITAFPLGYGLKGLWVVMILTQFFICICFYVLLKNHDWDDSVKEHLERKQSEQERQKDK